jgi:steroid 5-alpha reductase family enzyme
MAMKECLALAERVRQVFECVPVHGVDHCYVTHDALTIGWVLVVIVVIYSFVWSILGRNCSKVDQIWSITPILFVAHALYHYQRTHNGVWHIRLVLLTTLVSLWGIRLTFNFWRKGGYGNFFVHEEDYRWPILRKQMHPFIFWIVFNFSFIAAYQNVLLFLIAAPAFEIAKTSPYALLSQDYV